MTVFDLPPPVAAYIAATNASDIEALLTTLSDDALVNDHRDEFTDQDAIRNWAQHEIIDDRVTMQVSSATRRGDSVAVTATVDGNFDKTGLPDPLVLAFYFSVSGERIVQLIIVHNKPAA
jgi:ketosteroid isomerase-like protein